MDVSVFIRSLNEAPLLERCLKALSQQKTKLRFETILLDCSSSDNSLDIARSFDVTAYTIPRNLFTYASALNAGAQLCSGNLFVPLSAHAVPADDSWLENLAAPLLSSPNVTASFSRQMAWEDASSAEKEGLDEEFGNAAWQRDKANFQQMLNEKTEPYALLTFSNVSSCIRREFLLTHPFYELPYCEDRALALDVLSAGTAFAYVPESIVFNSTYPSFTNSLSIAERIAVSRAAINREAYRRFGIQDLELFNPLCKRHLERAIPLIARNSARALQGFLNPRENRKVRAAKYYSTFATRTLGELRAISAIQSDGPLPMKRSDPAKLLLQARKERKE